MAFTFTGILYLSAPAIPYGKIIFPNLSFPPNPFFPTTSNVASPTKSGVTSNGIVTVLDLPLVGLISRFGKSILKVSSRVSLLYLKS